MRKYGIILAASGRRRRSRGVLLHGRSPGAAAGQAGGRRSRAKGGAGRGRRRRFRRRRWRGGGGFSGPRPPMTVELASVTRQDMADTVTVVGNLIGAATVDAVPQGQGRLQSVSVKLGDPSAAASRSPRSKIAKFRSRSSSRKRRYGVAQATIRQRQADLKLAQNNLDRSKSLLRARAAPRQTMDDTDASYQAAQAQLDLAQARWKPRRVSTSSRSTSSNTVITAPVGRVHRQAHAGSGRQRGRQHVVHVGRGHPHGAARHQRRREGSAAHRHGTATEIEVDAFPGESSTAASRASRRSSTRRRARRRWKSRFRIRVTG